MTGAQAQSDGLNRWRRDLSASKKRIGRWKGEGGE